MGIFALSCLINGLLSLGLGIFVIVKNKKSRLNRLWSLVNFAVSVWSFGLLGVIIADTEKFAYYSNRVLYVGAILIPIFYFHFVSIMLGLKRRIILIGGYVLALFFSLVNVISPRIFVKSMASFSSFKYWLEPGYLYLPFFFFFIFFAGYSLYLLCRGYYQNEGIKREQIKYLLIGSIIGFSGGITDFFPQIIKVYPFGNYFVSIYVIFTTYAIIKYRFMDIKFVLKKSLVYALLLLIVSAIVAFLVFLLGGFFQNFFQASHIITASVCAFLIALIFQPLRGLIYNWLDKFWRRRRTVQQIKDEVGKTINNKIDLPNVLQKAADLIKKDLTVREFCFLVYNPKEKKYQTEFAMPLKNFSISASEYFASILKRENKIYVKEEIPFLREGAENEEEKDCLKKIEDKLREAGMEAAMPLSAHGELAAIFFFGGKKNGNAYSTQDIAYMEELSGELAPYLANVLSYQQAMEGILKGGILS